jgi:hypothetical protein
LKSLRLKNKSKVRTKSQETNGDSHHQPLNLFKGQAAITGVPQLLAHKAIATNGVLLLLRRINGELLRLLQMTVSGEITKVQELLEITLLLHKTIGAELLLLGQTILLTQILTLAEILLKDPTTSDNLQTTSDNPLITLATLLQMISVTIPLTTLLQTATSDPQVVNLLTLKEVLLREICFLQETCLLLKITLMQTTLMQDPRKDIILTWKVTLALHPQEETLAILWEDSLETLEIHLIWAVPRAETLI